jgi:hypothetical protein
MACAKLRMSRTTDSQHSLPNITLLKLIKILVSTALPAVLQFCLRSLLMMAVLPFQVGYTSTLSSLTWMMFSKSGLTSLTLLSAYVSHATGFSTQSSSIKLGMLNGFFSNTAMSTPIQLQSLLIPTFVYPSTWTMTPR